MYIHLINSSILSVLQGLRLLLTSQSFIKKLHCHLHFALNHGP